MRNHPLLWFILILSLAGNLYWMKTTRDKRSAAGVAATSAAATPISAVQAWRITARTLGTFPRSENSKELVGRLRAAGFSDAVIRSVIDALLQRKYGVGEGGRVRLSDHYWDKRFGGGTNAAPASSLYQKELADTLALLPDGDPSESAEHYNIPAVKLKAVLKMESDYRDLFGAIFLRNSAARALQSDQEAIALLRKEQAKDLAAILTPEELKEYDLRVSGASYQLRDQLGPMKPTEQEFRAIYGLRGDFDARFGALPADDPQRKAAEDALQAQLKASLGDSRYADYQLAQDPSFKSLSALARRLELPDGAAKQIYSMQTDLVAQAKNLRDQPTMDDDYRNRQLALMAQNAQATLQSRLGDIGYKAYLQFDGAWLKALSAPKKN